MKKSIILSSAFAVLAVSVFGAVTIKYVNKDAKAYNLQAKVGTSPSIVSFGASKMGTVTISGTETTAFINTQCGLVTVKDGASVTIEKGCMKVVQTR